MAAGLVGDAPGRLDPDSLNPDPGILLYRMRIRIQIQTKAFMDKIF